MVIEAADPSLQPGRREVCLGGRKTGDEPTEAKELATA
jgi:hypothetical protein